jgi:hypothetical protein
MDATMGDDARSASALRIQASAFGVFMGLGGIEHGIGEILQGNAAPGSWMFKSWGETELFSILNGEPAMSLIPSFLVSGIVTLVLSAIFMAWTAFYVHKRFGWLIMILLSVLMLLSGGGFGPPLVGIAFGAAASGIGSPHSWWRARLSPGAGRLLSAIWPWLFALCLASFFTMFPGLLFLPLIIGAEKAIYQTILLCLMPVSFALIPMTIIAGIGRDIAKGKSFPEPSTRPHR